MEFIKKEIKNHIAYITISRPPANAMNRQLYEELGAAFNTLYDELDDVRIAILTAEGKQFIAGNDLGEIDESGVSDMAFQANYFNNCISAIVNCPVPVIGAVNGAAVGAGFCVAAACDVLVAAQGARFGLPEMKVGVLGGMAFLPAMVPQKLGRYMTLTGALIPAEKLENYGSVHSVVPREELMAAAERIAEEAMQAPPLSLRAWKKCIKYIDRLDFASTEHITDLAFFDLMDTEDSDEAVKAFMEKRKPVYKGR
ncbi:MAG: enoyl-CoA hydratase/isomerase family protein [Anaerovoracaceae bacterium]